MIIDIRIVELSQILFLFCGRHFHHSAPQKKARQLGGEHFSTAAARLTSAIYTAEISALPESKYLQKVPFQI